MSLSKTLPLAASTVAPSVHTDSEQLSARQISRRLARAALWMTPKAVEGYDPEDFRDLPEDQQEELRNAVGRIRAAGELRFRPMSLPPTSSTKGGWNCSLASFLW